MREVSKMSFSYEERRLGWLSELLERASEEVSTNVSSPVSHGAALADTVSISKRTCNERE
jgi:hypothetical protein